MLKSLLSNSRVETLEHSSVNVVRIYIGHSYLRELLSHLYLINHGLKLTLSESICESLESKLAGTVVRVLRASDVPSYGVDIHQVVFSLLFRLTKSRLTKEELCQVDDGHEVDVHGLVELCVGELRHPLA